MFTKLEFLKISSLGNHQLIDLVAHSSEFENIMVREEEQEELQRLRHEACPLEVRRGPEDKIGKISILIQVWPANHIVICGSFLVVIQWTSSFNFLNINSS